MDIAILLLLFALSLMLSILSLRVMADGAEMLKMMHWAQSVVTFNATDAAAAMVDALDLQIAHYAGNDLCSSCSLQSPGPYLSVPVGYFHRNYQIVRSQVIYASRRSPS